MQIQIIKDLKTFCENFKKYLIDQNAATHLNFHPLPNLRSGILRLYIANLEHTICKLSDHIKLRENHAADNAVEELSDAKILDYALRVKQAFEAEAFTTQLKIESRIISTKFTPQLPATVENINVLKKQLAQVLENIQKATRFAFDCAQPQKEWLDALWKKVQHYDNLASAQNLTAHSQTSTPARLFILSQGHKTFPEKRITGTTFSIVNEAIVDVREIDARYEVASTLRPLPKARL